MEVEGRGLAICWQICHHSLCLVEQEWQWLRYWIWGGVIMHAMTMRTMRRRTKMVQVTVVVWWWCKRLSRWWWGCGGKGFKTARPCWQICHRFLPGCLLLGGGEKEEGRVKMMMRKLCWYIWATIFRLAAYCSGRRQRWTSDDNVDEYDYNDDDDGDDLSVSSSVRNFRLKG